MGVLFKIDTRINSILDKLYIYYLKNIKNINIGVNCKISRHTSFAGLEGKVRIGDNCVIENNVRVKVSSNIDKRKYVVTIKDNVFIGYGSIIDGNKSIEIRENTMIGPYVYITDSDHILRQKDVPISNQGGEYESTIIENNVWIGSSSIVLKGVTIGDNSIVAANSTVLTNMNNNSLIAGTPANIKKKIFED